MATDDELSSKFRTADGRLTPYSFACGYIEQRTTNPRAFRSNDIYTELYHEGEVYHVRQFEHRGAKICRVFWVCKETLAAARALFDRQPGRLVVRVRNGECVTR